MIQTVYMGNGTRTVTSPMKCGAGLFVEVQTLTDKPNEWKEIASFVMEEAAAGAFIFGVEQGFEAMGMMALRAA